MAETHRIMMDIKQSTIEAAIDLLNVHREHCRNKIIGSSEEKAYYKGLADMAELILSNHYTHNGYRVIMDEDKSGNLVFKAVKKVEE